MEFHTPKIYINIYVREDERLSVKINEEYNGEVLGVMGE